jgi:hypothetical protein
MVFRGMALVKKCLFSSGWASEGFVQFMSRDGKNFSL